MHSKVVVAYWALLEEILSGANVHQKLQLLADVQVLFVVVGGAIARLVVDDDDILIVAINTVDFAVQIELALAVVNGYQWRVAWLIFAIETEFRCNVLELGVSKLLLDNLAHLYCLGTQLRQYALHLRVGF